MPTQASYLYGVGLAKPDSSAQTAVADRVADRPSTARSRRKRSLARTETQRKAGILQVSRSPAA